MIHLSEVSFFQFSMKNLFFPAEKFSGVFTRLGKNILANRPEWLVPTILVISFSIVSCRGCFVGS